MKLTPEDLGGGGGRGGACSWTFAWPEGAWDLNCGQYLGGDSSP